MCVIYFLAEDLDYIFLKAHRSLGVPSRDTQHSVQHRGLKAIKFDRSSCVRHHYGLCGVAIQGFPCTKMIIQVIFQSKFLHEGILPTAIWIKLVEALQKYLPRHPQFENSFFSVCKYIINRHLSFKAVKNNILLE